MTSILSVPYIGQVGPGANEHGNDCGAAELQGVFTYAGKPAASVDALYNEIFPSGDAYLSVAGLMQASFKRSIDCDWDAPISTDRLVALVKAGNPVIALIKYGDLAKIRPNPFKGSHFVTVIDGDDKTVTIHDPLNSPTSGANIKVPRAMWDDCWTGLDDQNPDRGGIIFNLQMVQQSPVEQSDIVTINTIGLKLRPEPNTTTPEICILKHGQKFKKAGPVLPGTGIVKGWQPAIVYLGTGVLGDPEPYVK